jgi:hypothetical protein
MADWYRRKTWTKEDEQEFYLKLGRARKDSRGQYLKIQALELLDTKEENLLQVAEGLLHSVLTEYPDDNFNRASVLGALDDIYNREKTTKKHLNISDGHWTLSGYIQTLEPTVT